MIPEKALKKVLPKQGFITGRRRIQSILIMFFASPFWKKLQSKNGQPCMSKMDNVATGHPSI